MSHPAIKLILSDIDGTILPHGQHEVSPRTHAAFRAALDAGIVIGPASGRGAAQLAPFFGGDAACCATAIATNGLEVYHAGEKLCECRPPREGLEQLLAFVRTLPRAGLICFDGDLPVLCAGSVDDLAQVMPGYAARCRICDGLPEFPVVKSNVFMVTDEAGTAVLVDKLNAEVEGVDFDSPMVGYTNNMPAGWNKGTAVRLLCEHLGISTDEVVVFGDAGNDLTMFEVAGHAVAVANATPEAAAAARWHIGRCEDDAVAAAIEAIAAGEWPFER